ncbi:hypothetical protein T492DRAFT_44435 [Pavlovales sp. CCMP2436]|nr:hypothetical protein T492DRAFT_44435 [Pavlovales sp. CCMP2436]
MWSQRPLWTRHPSCFYRASGWVPFTSTHSSRRWALSGLCTLWTGWDRARAGQTTSRLRRGAILLLMLFCCFGYHLPPPRLSRGATLVLMLFCCFGDHPPHPRLSRGATLLLMLFCCFGYYPLPPG